MGYCDLWYKDICTSGTTGLCKCFPILSHFLFFAHAIPLFTLAIPALSTKVIRNYPPTPFTPSRLYLHLFACSRYSRTLESSFSLVIRYSYSYGEGRQKEALWNIQMPATGRHVRVPAALAVVILPLVPALFTRMSRRSSVLRTLSVKFRTDLCEDRSTIFSTTC